MAQRYEKLFSLSQRLYCPDAPVIVCAAQLLRDGYTKKLLAQIKYQSVSDKCISSLTVSLNVFDSAKRSVSAPVIYKYTELSVARDENFGQKSAVVLPFYEAQSFDISVDEVVFSDGSSWQRGDASWSALKEQKTLSENLKDSELASQYQIRYGSDCKFEPFDEMGLWFCTCGAVNRMDERGCHKCRRVYTALRDISIDSLKKECSQRLENEKEQQAADDESSRQKRKNFRSMALALLPVLAVLILVAVFVPRGLKKDSKETAAEPVSGEASGLISAVSDYVYMAQQNLNNVPYEETLELLRYAENANPVGLKLIGVSESSLSEGDNIALILYEAAAERFAGFGDYKDSPQLYESCMLAIEEINNQALQADYDAALQLLNEQNFLLARDAFLALGDYSDSSEMAQEAVYQKALLLYGFMSQRNVRNVFASISTDSEVSSVISFSKDFALSNGEGYITEFKAACGKDAVEFSLEDSPAQELLPFADALTELFVSLGDYKDSADYIPQIESLSDYTREFYALVAEGDVYAAYDWLSSYEYEFENREEWLSNLNMYKPYCGYWVLNSGDASLIPYIAGVSRNGTNICTAINTRVIIGDDAATLKISNAGEEEYSIELRTELGSNSGFSNSDNPPFNYFINISVLNRLAVMKYDSSGNIVSSCDYSLSE